METHGNNISTDWISLRVLARKSSSSTGETIAAALARKDAGPSKGIQRRSRDYRV